MDEIQIHRAPGAGQDVTIVSLLGPLTITTVFDFQAVIHDPEMKSTIIDFSGVTYIDSAGLGMVLSHWAHTQRMGVNFAAVAIPERVQVLLRMTGVATVMPCYPTVADAERAFANVANPSSVMAR